MLFGVLHVERDGNRWVEGTYSLRAEVRTGVEGHAINALVDYFAVFKELAHATLPVGHTERDRVPFALFIRFFEVDRNSGCGAPKRGVENVRGDATHFSMFEEDQGPGSANQGATEAVLRAFLVF